MNDFNKRAKTWDDNPMYWERSKAIAEKLLQNIDLNPSMTALEYGSGTGIMSFLLRDSFREITLMDSSIEMIRVVEEKIRKEGVTHFHPLFLDLETTDYQEKTFDVIFSHMVMHHLRDVKMMISRFYKMLNAGGSIAIADLYTEDGSFHDEGFQGPRGFDPQVLGQLLADCGFKNIKHEQCYVIQKQVTSNNIKNFPVFILTANKVSTDTLTGK